MSENTLERIKETIEYIRSKVSFEPQIGIILGTGLGGLVKEINVSHTLPYEEIPNFPVSTVKGHQGRLIFGKLGNKNVVAMQGRFHYYEGYTMKEITFPVSVMKFLGVELLIVSNASGGINPAFEIGDLMIITDHINLMASNPLIGYNDSQLGPKFPDMSEAYDSELVQKAKKIARQNNIKYQTGVYAAVSGPCFETPAEYRYIRIIGADAVGMSTVPEVIGARHLGMKVFAVSVITDLGVSGKIVEISHEEVIDTASHAEPNMTMLIKRLFASF